MKTLTVLALSASVAFTATTTMATTGEVGIHAAEGENADAPTLSERMSNGEQLYSANCAACHQANGKGLAGAFPPLAESDYFADDPMKAVSAVINGLSGPITVNGIEYISVMPNLAYLSNSDVADVVTYISNAFGNYGGEVSAAQVAAVRGSEKVMGTAVESSVQMSDLAASSAIAQQKETDRFMDSKGPKITRQEYDHATDIFFQQCAGCHGAMRKGAVGKPLTIDITRQKGTDYLKALITYGSTAGMHNWGTSGDLTKTEIDSMARFLQHEPPAPPGWGMPKMIDSWKLLIKPEDRPTEPQHNLNIENFFAITLRDSRQLVIIDGDTRETVAIIKTGYAVSAARPSASGRYLFSIGHDAEIVMIDLWMSPPKRVAEIKVGLQAGTIESSSFDGFADKYAIAGTYWPPQYAIMDGETLEPLKVVSTRGMTSDARKYHPAPSVAGIAASHERPDFIVNVNETGKTLLVNYEDINNLTVTTIGAARSLQGGSWDSSHRYFLTAAKQSSRIAVIDSRERSLAALIDTTGIPRPVGGANVIDPEFGPVWVTSILDNERVVFMGTDPEGHPQHAWKVVRTLEGPGGGSLFVKSHPRSGNLWIDATLSPETRFSQSIAVYDVNNPGAGFELLPVAEWADLGVGPKRVLQLEYNMAGDEVWISVSHGSKQQSTIVIVDDKTRELKAVIKEPGVVMPTGKFNIYNTIHDIY